MHQGYWGVERTLKVLERFERFNLPIHFTENTIISGQLMPPEIVDLNDYQVKDWPPHPRRRTSGPPGGSALQDPLIPSGRACHHLVGFIRWRLAECTRRFAAQGSFH